MRVPGLLMMFFFFSTTSALSANDPGFMWLEKIERGQSMSSSASKQGGKKNEKKPDMAAMMKKIAEKKKKEQEEGKEKKQRPAMSRPAKLLLKAGAYLDPAKNLKPPFLINSSCYLQVPNRKIHQIKPEKKRYGYRLYDEAMAGGFYQLFAYNDYGVKDGVRYHLFSQSRFRNYGEDDGVRLQDDSIQKRPGMIKDRPEFYLLDVVSDLSEDRYADRKYTGDTLAFQLSLDGETIEGADVTLITSQGWRKSAKTDKEGKVSFTLIKEIFHHDGVQLDAAPYLAMAEFSRSESGVMNNEPYSKAVYRVARHYSVRPTPLDWKSKQLGFLTIGGVFIAVFFAAGVRRRRRNWYESR